MHYKTLNPKISPSVLPLYNLNWQKQTNEMKLTYECQWVILHDFDRANCNPRGDNGEGIRQKQTNEMKFSCEFQCVILHDFDMANQELRRRKRQWEEGYGSEFEGKCKRIEPKLCI